MLEAAPLPSYEYASLHGIDLLLLRVGGVGLANLLFPWARACVAAQRDGTRLIRPTWPQLKIGPLLRGEADPRAYRRVMRPLPDEITGAQRLALLLAHRCRLMPEHRLRLHQGMAGHFNELLPHAEMLSRRLHASCQAPPTADRQAELRPTIALHVRLGDFAVGADPESHLRSGRSGMRLPMTWYLRQLVLARERHGPETRFSLFSDGRDEELRPLLAEPGVQRVQAGDALSELLHMAACGRLIASASTYSMWAAFLMQRPSVWHPGALQHPVNADRQLAREQA